MVGVVSITTHENRGLGLLSGTHVDEIGAGLICIFLVVPVSNGSRGREAGGARSD